MQQSFRTSLRIFLSGLYNLRAECFAEITCQDTYFPLERFYQGILNTETTSLGKRFLKCIRSSYLYLSLFFICTYYDCSTFNLFDRAIMKIAAWNRRIVSKFLNLWIRYGYWENFDSLSLENWKSKIVALISFKTYMRWKIILK